MADYMFIKFDGIKGTAKQAKFEDFIEVKSFSENYMYNVACGEITSAGTSVSHSGFTISKAIDKATPELLNHLNQRLQVKKVTFHMLTDDIGLGGNAGGKKLIYEVEMEDCRIANVSVAGVDGQGLPDETVTIVYGKITWKYDGAVAAHNFRDWANGK